VNRSFFYGSIDDGKGFRKELLGFLFVAVCYGLSQRLDMRAQHRPVASVDGVSAEASPPLSDCGLVISHFFLLQRNGMIRYLRPKVNLLLSLGGIV
jgi:hypothetical protein